MPEIKKIDLSAVELRSTAESVKPSKKGLSLKTLAGAWSLAGKKEKIEVIAVVLILLTTIGFFSYYLISRKPATQPSSLPFPPAEESILPTLPNE